MTLLEFANEYHAWNELTIMANNQREWIFQHPVSVPLLTDPEIINLGFNWYEYPLFKEQNLKAGFERIANEADKFFAELGFEHIPNTGKYKVTKKNDERVALFAHQGFGTAFLSALLDIPYPTYASRFGMTHTGVTVINFSTDGDVCVPTVLSLSNDSHIYKEGLPTRYNNGVFF